MSDENQIDGVRLDQIVHLEERQVDTRPFSKRLRDNLISSSQRMKLVIFILLAIGVGYDFSFRYLDLAFFLLAVYLLVIGFFGMEKQFIFSAPMSAALGKYTTDFKKNKIAYILPDGREADGLIFFGLSVERSLFGEELWLSDDYVRRHMLLFGTTGAGKTEALLSLCYGALLSCSGFLFSDGKGTFELYYKVHNTCKKLGQNDDLLLMSFLTGKEDIRKATSQKISNTLNPIAKATQEGASQLIVSLMASNGGGSGDMWSERAAVLMESVMGYLVWQRENRKRPISIDAVRDTLVLSNYHEIWFNAQSVDDESDSRWLPDYVLKAMNGYLVSLPGFMADKEFKDQPETVSEQHGFLFMQFSKLLGSLADTYGYIFNTQLSEIDFWDVVTNRRVLVVLLPALAKSKQELAMLGKIVIACIKQMMTSGLGAQLEGFAGAMKRANPTSSMTPFITILDEFGYYAVPGSSVMPAQARSLGFFMIFAGQDFPAFSSSGVEEAKAIVANCKLQVCMALQDEGDTFRIFKEKAGTATVYAKSGKNYRDGSLEDNNNVSTETKQVIEFNDLSRQKSGYAHFLLEGKLARGRFFYAAIPLSDHHEIVVNQFVKVAPPSEEMIKALNESFNNVYNLITNLQYHEAKKYDYAEDAQGDQTEGLSNLLKMYQQAYPNSPLAATCAAIAHTTYNQNKEVSSTEERKASETANYSNNQVSFVKDNAVHSAQLDKYEAEMKEAGKKPVAPLGTPEAVFDEDMIEIQSVVSESHNSNTRAVEKLKKDINKSVAYPSNVTPSGMSGKSMAKLIEDYDEMAKSQSLIIKDGKRVRTGTDTE